ncbi:hypothetical protein [Trujillonella endophytica]|uniref:Uncharacterized protein n=1 Tax=Trujillonella endophytica TaxID=673521 RepID=A0A1H8WH96_9ACTN|nr:hypothetical protein [Trujillella endophytica]SEP27011.1 hypothetical protein SAMN05660991_04414 [Trujillella endophytica]
MPGETVVLLWPAVTLAGFFVLAALVVALGTRSTALYEFERNAVQAQRQRAAVAVPAADALAATVVDTVALTGGHLPAEPAEAAAEARAGSAGTVGIATHPAGKRLGEAGSPPAWWLVDDDADQPGQHAVAGPYDDRVEADWALLALGLAESTRVVFGSQRTDGTVVRRQLPAERAWLAELGEQLDRLATEWDDLVSDDDALTTLVVEVAAALVEAGLPLHDCAGEGAAGGVCLSPGPANAGVLVTWHQHNRMSVQQVRGAAMESAVQRTMNAAVADLLRTVGFEVEAFGSSGCWMVTPGPR